MPPVALDPGEREPAAQPPRAFVGSTSRTGSGSDRALTRDPKTRLMRSCRSAPQILISSSFVGGSSIEPGRATKIRGALMSSRRVLTRGSPNSASIAACSSASQRARRRAQRDPHPPSPASSRDGGNHARPPSRPPATTPIPSSAGKRLSGSPPTRSRPARPRRRSGTRCGRTPSASASTRRRWPRRIIYDAREDELAALRESFPLQPGQSGAVLALGGDRLCLDYVSAGCVPAPLPEAARGLPARRNRVARRRAGAGRAVPRRGREGSRQPPPLGGARRGPATPRRRRRGLGPWSLTAS